MSSSVPAGVDLTKLTGPVLIGSLVNYYLHGVLSVQVYIYYLSFPRDRKVFKFLVAGIFILETLQTCLITADVFFWLGSGFGDVPRLYNTYLSEWDTPLLGSIVSCIVQLFFCYRIWVMKKSIWWASALIACVAVMQLIGGFKAALRVHFDPDFFKAHPQFADVYIWLVGNAVADVMIAVTMTILFLRMRQERAYGPTNAIILRLVRLVLETNTLTAGMAILSVAVFATDPKTFYFVCTTLVLGKLYANTLLVTFNNRAFISHSLEHGPELSGFEVGPSRNISRTRPIAINVTKSFGDSIDLNAFSDGENRNISDLGRMESARVKYHPAETFGTSTTTTNIP